MLRNIGAVVFLFSVFSLSNAHATTIETFDSAADMIALLDLDVYAGDSDTEWSPDQLGRVHFNQFTTSNSVSLKDNNLSIFSFEFYEWTAEATTGNEWTWSFYDASDLLVGVVSYTNTGDSALQTMNLLAMGLLGVNTVRLNHPSGWMDLDNLAYGIATVPLPAAAWLFISGLAGLLGFKRYKAA